MVSLEGRRANPDGLPAQLLKLGGTRHPFGERLQVPVSRAGGIATG